MALGTRTIDESTNRQSFMCVFFIFSFLKPCVGRFYLVYLAVDSCHGRLEHAEQSIRNQVETQIQPLW
jgi:hypothetical protein